MTLCRFRPLRTYDAQFIVELTDAHGLLKKLDEAVAEMGEAGLASTPYYVGALLAFRTLFGDAQGNGEVDKWTEFVASFEKALEEMEEV